MLISNDHQPDFADVRGLALPRRAIEIMIAGEHNLLLHGPRGCGKSMLARRARGIMPDLDDESAEDTLRVIGLDINSIDPRCARRPPVRMPHHTTSISGMLGGGNPVMPGEISRAHCGLLFLDELPEFPRAILEGLREPLESYEVEIFRRGAGPLVTYPAAFDMLGAMNACPCGWLGHHERACTCSPTGVERYQARVKPLLEHFHMAVEVGPLTQDDLDAERVGIERASREHGHRESSADILARVVRARARREARRVAHTNIERQLELVDIMKRLAPILPEHFFATPPSDLVLERARFTRKFDTANLARVARTIEDLDGEDGSPVSDASFALAAQLWKLPSTLEVAT